MNLPVHERFRAWFQSLKISQAEMAKRLKCDQSVVSYLLSGHRNAGIKVAVAIERASRKWEQGPIRAFEWIPEAIAS